MNIQSSQNQTHKHITNLSNQNRNGLRLSMSLKLTNIFKETNSPAETTFNFRYGQAPPWAPFFSLFFFFHEMRASSLSLNLFVFVFLFKFLFTNSAERKKDSAPLAVLNGQMSSPKITFTCTHIPLSSCHVAQPQRATCPEVRKSRFSKI